MQKAEQVNKYVRLEIAKMFLEKWLEELEADENTSQGIIKIVTRKIVELDNRMKNDFEKIKIPTAHFY